MTGMVQASSYAVQVRLQAGNPGSEQQSLDAMSMDEPGLR